jgi:hypothetical protein
MCLVSENDVKFFVNRLEYKLGFEMDILFSEEQKRELSDVRKCIYKLLNEELGWTVERIGRLFNRDHSTIVVALRTINQGEIDTYHASLSSLFIAVKSLFTSMCAVPEVANG